MPRQPHSMAQISFPTSSKDSEQADIQNSHHCQMIFHVISTLYAAIQYYTTTFYDKVEYHTLALTGHAWVLELLTGHPKIIRCELGVHDHVFYALLHHLQTIGYTNAHGESGLMLEEQLTIFLYTCITGLSIHHVREHFQHANRTISQCIFLLYINLYLTAIFNSYFQLILTIFSSQPFYTDYVHLPSETDPILPEICNNPKHYPFFCDAIGAIDGKHIICSPSETEYAAACNGASYPKLSDGM